MERPCALWPVTTRRMPFGIPIPVTDVAPRLTKRRQVDAEDTESGQQGARHAGADRLFEQPSPSGIRGTVGHALSVIVFCHVTLPKRMAVSLCGPQASAQNVSRVMQDGSPYQRTMRVSLTTNVRLSSDVNPIGLVSRPSE